MTSFNNKKYVYNPNIINMTSFNNKKYVYNPNIWKSRTKLQQNYKS